VEGKERGCGEERTWRGENTFSKSSSPKVPPRSHALHTFWRLIHEGSSLSLRVLIRGVALDLPICELRLVSYPLVLELGVWNRRMGMLMGKGEEGREEEGREGEVQLK
jgi:hypothetical protein